MYNNKQDEKGCQFLPSNVSETINSLYETWNNLRLVNSSAKHNLRRKYKESYTRVRNQNYNHLIFQTKKGFN